MTEKRKGRQTPTQSVVLPYSDTKGKEAIDQYNKTGRTAQEWQELMLCDILAEFRTRSSKGGLGEGFDLLVIDEAQEYTDD